MFVARKVIDYDETSSNKNIGHHYIKIPEAFKKKHLSKHQLGLEGAKITKKPTPLKNYQKTIEKAL